MGVISKRSPQDEWSPKVLDVDCIKLVSRSLGVEFSFCKWIPLATSTGRQSTSGSRANMEQIPWSHQRRSQVCVSNRRHSETFMDNETMNKPKHGFAILFVQLQSISFLPKKHLQLKQNDRALSVLPKIPPKNDADINDIGYLKTVRCRALLQISHLWKELLGRRVGQNMFKQNRPLMAASSSSTWNFPTQTYDLL